jgi:hypothetical protein
MGMPAPEQWQGGNIIVQVMKCAQIEVRGTVIEQEWRRGSSYSSASWVATRSRGQEWSRFT